MKKRVKRKKKIGKTKLIKFIFIILIIIFLCLLGYYIHEISTPKIKDSGIIASNKEDENNKETINELSMIMVGDSLIHGAVYLDAYNSTTKSYDFKKHVEYIKPIVQKYDLAFYNQESILGGTELGLSSYPRFNSPYEVGDAMLDAGFNMVSLANNHTLDRGESAIINSSNYWKKQEGVITAGSYASKEDSEAIKIMEKNNITYTLLSYTTTTNGLKAPLGKEYFVNVYSEEKVKSDVDKVRDKVDVLIVSMHWGSEYTNTPTQIQRNQASYLASLGIDIVIGHHPHVVEPVTWIDDTLVFYSLGNFISAQENVGEYNRLVGLMSSLDITKKTKNNETTVTIDNINNELIYTYYNSSWRNYKVIPFSSMTSTYNYNYQYLYEKYSKVVKMYDKTMTVNALN